MKAHDLISPPVYCIGDIKISVATPYDTAYYHTNYATNSQTEKVSRIE